MAGGQYFIAGVATIIALDLLYALAGSIARGQSGRVPEPTPDTDTNDERLSDVANGRHH